MYGIYKISVLEINFQEQRKNFKDFKTKDFKIFIFTADDRSNFRTFEVFTILS